MSVGDTVANAAIDRDEVEVQQLDRIAELHEKLAVSRAESEARGIIIKSDAAEIERLRAECMWLRQAITLAIQDLSVTNILSDNSSITQIYRMLQTALAAPPPGTDAPQNPIAVTKTNQRVCYDPNASSAH